MYFQKLLGIEKIPKDAKIIQREAVRGVVFKDGDLLFMINTSYGDYKFPGGGIEEGEDHLTALVREFVEETGFAISKEIDLIGLIIEQKVDDYESNAYFCMKSYYYKCELIGENQGQKLEKYEKELDFKAEYVSASFAIKVNNHLMKINSVNRTPWIERELIALENILEQFNGKDQEVLK